MDASIANWWRAYSPRPPVLRCNQRTQARHASFARAFENYRTRALNFGAPPTVAVVAEQVVMDLASYGEIAPATIERLRALTLPQPIPLSDRGRCLVLAALEIGRGAQCSDRFLERLLAVVETA